MIHPLVEIRQHQSVRSTAYQEGSDRSAIRTDEDAEHLFGPEPRRLCYDLRPPLPSLPWLRMLRTWGGRQESESAQTPSINSGTGLSHRLATSEIISRENLDMR